MKKNLPILIFTAAVLLAIALFMQTPTGPRDLSGSQLLNDVKLEDINKIVIEKGNEKTTLLRSDKGYAVEEKEGYSADTAKADSLLVELLNMKGTEWITSKEEKLAGFGLSHGNKAALSVSLHSGKDKELGGIIIGHTAKTAAESPKGYSLKASRYVRAKGKDDVFLISKVTLLQAKPSDWLSRELLQIKKEEIAAIEVNHGEKKESFKLKKIEGKDFEPDGFSIPSGKKLKTYIINGIGNALANLRLTDCMKKETGTAEGLEFNAIFTARLKDGREYRISSAEKERDGQTKHYIKISASFAEPGKKEEGKGQEEAKNPGETAPKDKDRFSGWIFQVSSTNNFTYKKSDLFEDE